MKGNCRRIAGEKCAVDRQISMQDAQQPWMVLMVTKSASSSNAAAAITRKAEGSES